MFLRPKKKKKGGIVIRKGIRLLTGRNISDRKVSTLRHLATKSQ